MHLAAFVLVLTVTFGLFALGVMGGGDAKLMASTALWFGLGAGLMNYLLLATMAGGALTLALLVFRKSPLATVAGEVRVLRRIIDEKDIPYGIALAIGGLGAFQHSPAMLLFTTNTGLFIIGVSLVWMSIGIFVMRQMINFDV